MKNAARLLYAILLFCAPLLAQLPTDSPVDVIRHPVWNKGVFVGGSTSFANTPSAQTMLAGVRIGRVLMHERGSNFLRGTFEMDLDVIPINEFWYDGNAQYAAAINPFIAKWNFTSGCKVAPYIAAVGGIVFSTQNLPPGDTSVVNFTSGAEFGAQLFRPERRSVDLAVKIYHLSNASIGNKNPGINGAVQFTIGYTWH
jgi:lipid A 3-O-deacylase